MRKYIFLIGDFSDFDSAEELATAYLSGEEEFSKYNASAYHISLSEECKVGGYLSLADIAIEIGRGQAMSRGWSRDGTFNCLIAD